MAKTQYLNLAGTKKRGSKKIPLETIKEELKREGVEPLPDSYKYESLHEKNFREMLEATLNNNQLHDSLKEIQKQFPTGTQVKIGEKVGEVFGTCVYPDQNKGPELRAWVLWTNDMGNTNLNSFPVKEVSIIPL